VGRRGYAQDINAGLSVLLPVICQPCHGVHPGQPDGRRLFTTQLAGRRGEPFIQRSSALLPERSVQLLTLLRERSVQLLTLFLRVFSVSLLPPALVSYRACIVLASLSSSIVCGWRQRYWPISCRRLARLRLSPYHILIGVV
jgi:hypothetical protein